MNECLLVYLDEEHENNEIVVLKFQILQGLGVIVELLAFVNEFDRIDFFLFLCRNLRLEFCNLHQQQIRRRWERNYVGEKRWMNNKVRVKVKCTVAVSSKLRSKKSVPLSVLTLIFIICLFVVVWIDWYASVCLKSLIVGNVRLFTCFIWLFGVLLFLWNWFLVCSALCSLPFTY